jgi:hypothetical protein
LPESLPSRAIATLGKKRFIYSYFFISFSFQRATLASY